MKKNLLSLIILLFACSMQTTVYAQKNERIQRVERKADARINRQTSYIASQLMLNDAESSRFKRLYTTYQIELRECQKQMRANYGKREGKERKELTDAEITERIEKRFAQAHKILDIREKYYQEFKKILKPRQIQKMYKAEKEIQKKVRKEMGRRVNKPRPERK